MICHIALAPLWDEAQSGDAYRWSSLDQTIDEVGFMHASDSYEQAWRVARFLLEDVTGELVLLDLDRERIEAHGLEVRCEPLSPLHPGSECFPHIYGGDLPLDCVSQVRRYAGVDELVEALLAYQAAGSPAGRREPTPTPQD